MAASSVKTRVYLRIEVTEVLDGDLGSAPKPHVFTYDETFLSGNGSGQNNLVYSDSRSLAATTADLDLASALTAGDGSAMTFGKMTILAAKHKGLVSGTTLKVGGDAASVPFCGAAADFVSIGPKGLFLAVNPLDGWTVTATTADIVQLETSATSDLDVLIVGRT